MRSFQFRLIGEKNIGDALSRMDGQFGLERLPVRFYHSAKTSNLHLWPVASIGFDVYLIFYQEKNIMFFFGFCVLFSLFCASICVPLQPYNDPRFLDSEIRRVRAGKAAEDAVLPFAIKERLGRVGASDEAEKGYDHYDYTSSEELDVTCAPGKGWHERGQRCVAINCIGGHDRRDFDTGECIHGPIIPPMARYKPYSMWNSLNHIYKNHPVQRYYSRGMQSLFRRG